MYNYFMSDKGSDFNIESYIEPINVLCKKIACPLFRASAGTHTHTNNIYLLKSFVKII